MKQLNVLLGSLLIGLGTDARPVCLILSVIGLALVLFSTDIVDKPQSKL